MVNFVFERYNILTYLLRTLILTSHYRDKINVSKPMEETKEKNCKKILSTETEQKNNKYFFAKGFEISIVRLCWCIMPT
jgi:hypothetical protein